MLVEYICISLDGSRTGAEVLILRILWTHFKLDKLNGIYQTINIKLWIQFQFNLSIHFINLNMHIEFKFIKCLGIWPWTEVLIKYRTRAFFVAFSSSWVSKASIHSMFVRGNSKRLFASQQVICCWTVLGCSRVYECLSAQSLLHLAGLEWHWGLWEFRFLPLKRTRTSYAHLIFVIQS